MSTIRIRRHRQHRRFVTIKSGVAGALLGLAIGGLWLLQARVSGAPLPVNEAVLIVLTTTLFAVIVATVTWIVMQSLQWAWRRIRSHPTDRL